MPWKPPAQPTGYRGDARGPPTADDNKRASTGRARARVRPTDHTARARPRGPALCGAKMGASLAVPRAEEGVTQSRQGVAMETGAECVLARAVIGAEP